MDSDKVLTVQHQPVPRNTKDVQASSGLANFYCRFVEDFLCIVKQLPERSKEKTSASGNIALNVTH